MLDAASAVCAAGPQDSPGTGGRGGVPGCCAWARGGDGNFPLASGSGPSRAVASAGPAACRNPGLSPWAQRGAPCGAACSPLPGHERLGAARDSWAAPGGVGGHRGAAPAGSLAEVQRSPQRLAGLQLYSHAGAAATANKRAPAEAVFLGMGVLGGGLGSHGFLWLRKQRPLPPALSPRGSWPPPHPPPPRGC